jgi:hypothetical protein
VHELCPNGPKTSLNWISKIDNRRYIYNVLMYTVLATTAHQQGSRHV